MDIERSDRFTQRLSKELDRWAGHLNNHLNVNLPFGCPSYDRFLDQITCRRAVRRSVGWGCRFSVREPATPIA